MGKTYFLPPDFWSYPAAIGDNPGAIQLGQLISSIDDPGHAVATLAPLDMSAYKMPIGTTKAAGLGHRDTSESSFLSDLFLKAVSIVGAKLKVKVQSSESLLSTIAQIESLVIDPKDGYVKESLSQPEVQAWLKAGWPRKRVFMVTGLLVATPNAESSISVSSTRQVAAEGEASASGLAAQVPVQGGGAMGGSSQRESGLDFVPMTPFIYAFRLRECFLKKMVGSSKPFTKGAKMSVGDNREGGPTAQKQDEDFVVKCSGISKRDVNVGSLGEAGDSFREVSLGDYEGETVSLIVEKGIA